MDILGFLEKLLNVSDNQNKSLEMIFEQFLSKVDEPANNFLKRLSSCSGNSDMLNLVKEHFEWTPLSPAIRNKYKKNREISTTFRNLGNVAFQKKNYMDSVRLYSLAAIFAIPGEAELGLAYANRSAALNSMGLTDEAVKDIHLALAKDYYPNDVNMLKKLKDRKIRFEGQLEERLRNASFELKLQEEISRRNEFYRDLFTLLTPNPLAPALADSVEIKCSPSRGRHVVAKMDIPIGTTILVERPFVAALKNALSWDVDHCHHCLKKNFRCIPCPQCVFTQYCNETCRADAQVYHQYECSCLPELHCILTDEMGRANIHLAFKLICLVGPTKLFAMFTERRGQKQRNDGHSLSSKNSGVDPGPGPGTGSLIAGSDPATGVYDHTSYSTAYNLMTCKTPTEGYYLFLLSLSLSSTLDSNTHFFKSVTTESCTEGEKYEFQDFIAELIIHHFETFRRNVYEIEEIRGLDGITLRTYMEMEEPKGRLDIDLKHYALGALTAASLINHSCNQNVMRFFGKTFGTTAVIALKPLSKGEELLISYGPLYGSLRAQDGSTKSRQTVLHDKYEFTCNCIACRYDWPGYRELKLSNLTSGGRMTGKLQFCCPICSAKFPHENRMSSGFGQCSLTGTFKCKLCRSQQSQQTISNEGISHCKALEVCMQLVLEDIVKSSSLETISTLKSALEFFESYVCPPNYQSLDGSLLYRDNVKFIIYFSDLQV